jgi:rfaE bifunctional protein nucleotidyltransferase chain/domain
LKRNFQKIISNKLKTPQEILDIKSKLQKENKTLAFTNGCFDILHRGHIEYLSKASELADFLVIGLNSDASVKAQNKSPERPINNQEARAINLSALLFVDAVVIFEETTPNELINLIVPDVLVKGGDYDTKETNPSSKKYIIGSDTVLKSGGEVITIPLVEGYSTTSILQKMNKP